MMYLFMYLLKASFVFTVFFVLYKTLLSRLTFHTVNRFLLIAIMPISLLIPFSSHFIPRSLHTSLEIPFTSYISFDSIIEVSSAVNTSQATTLDYWELATAMYILIVTFILFKRIRTILKLLVLKRNSKTCIRDGYQLIEIKRATIFSFFKWIFVPEGTAKDIDPIVLEHEKTHSELKHSFDIIIAEIYTAFFWFNPLVYFFKKDLKSVHEFQVDLTLTKKGVTPLEYLELLLAHLTTEKQETLYNYFNYSILKKRVDMMVKTQSHQYKKLGYLLIIPLSLFLCMSFLEKNYEIPRQPKEHALNQETTFVFPVKNGSQEDITSPFGAKRTSLKLKQNRVHQGIDIRAHEGVSVVAANEGIVVKASKENGWGNLIVIKHTNGYETWYAHLKDIDVSVHQKIKKGEHIGSIGKTGNAFGFHLHFELRHQGKTINPIHHIK